MKGEDRVREAFERNRRALERRPGLGQGTAVTRIRVREGVTCDIIFQRPQDVRREVRITAPSA
jgi:hypothetical protein